MKQDAVFSVKWVVDAITYFLNSFLTSVKWVHVAFQAPKHQHKWQFMELGVLSYAVVYTTIISWLRNCFLALLVMSCLDAPSINLISRKAGDHKMTWRAGTTATQRWSFQERPCPSPPSQRCTEKLIQEIMYLSRYCKVPFTTSFLSSLTVSHSQAGPKHRAGLVGWCDTGASRFNV